MKEFRTYRILGSHGIEKPATKIYQLYIYILLSLKSNTSPIQKVLYCNMQESNIITYYTDILHT